MKIICKKLWKLCKRIKNLILQDKEVEYYQKSATKLRYDVRTYQGPQNQLCLQSGKLVFVMRPQPNSCYGAPDRLSPALLTQNQTDRSMQDLNSNRIKQTNAKRVPLIDSRNHLVDCQQGP